jgi:hypothetical protein
MDCMIVVNRCKIGEWNEWMIACVHGRVGWKREPRGWRRGKRDEQDSRDVLDDRSREVAFKLIVCGWGGCNSGSNLLQATVAWPSVLFVGRILLRPHHFPLLLELDFPISLPECATSDGYILSDILEQRACTGEVPGGAKSYMGDVSGDSRGPRHERSSKRA